MFFENTALDKVLVSWSGALGALFYLHFTVFLVNV